MPNVTKYKHNTYTPNAINIDSNKTITNREWDICPICSSDEIIDMLERNNNKGYYYNNTIICYDHDHNIKIKIFNIKQCDTDLCGDIEYDTMVETFNHASCQCSYDVTCDKNEEINTVITMGGTFNIHDNNIVIELIPKIVM